MPYAALPGLRMQWDRDGSSYVTYSGTGAISTRTLAERQFQNNEGGANELAGSGLTHAIVFPELRNLMGIHVSGSNSLSAAPSYSTDTTNGQDGTWTTITITGTYYNSGTDTPLLARTRVGTTSVTGVKAIRMNSSASAGSQNINSIHLYGHRTASGNYLEWWDATLDQRASAAPFDFGDPVQGTSSVQSLRLKNLSSTQTANTITISDAALTDATPSVPPQYEYSINGGAYAQEPVLASLAAGATATVNIRRTTPIGANLGVHTIQMVASASTWT